MRRLAIVPFVACLLLSFEVQAQLTPLVSGTTFLPACKKALAMWDKGEAAGLSTMGQAEGMVCIAFVSGFVSGTGTATGIAAFRAYGEKQAGKSFRRLAIYCLPDRASTPQTVRVVVNYLERHPEKLHMDPATLVAIALQDAFPCDQSQ